MWRAPNSILALSSVPVGNNKGWVKIKYKHGPEFLVPRRQFGMFIARALKSVLKIRYLVLGGAAAGSVSLHQV